jgi:hypothetical protein
MLKERAVGRVLKKNTKKSLKDIYAFIQLIFNYLNTILIMKIIR